MSFEGANPRGDHIKALHINHQKYTKQNHCDVRTNPHQMPVKRSVLSHPLISRSRSGSSVGVVFPFRSLLLDSGHI